MSGINLVHSSTKIGRERWDWSVWLEGAPAELDLVDRVVYRLHPTFPNPERVVSDRATQFRLQSNGWGEFMIYADVTRKGLPSLELRHWLTLEGAMLPADESTAKSVFLSTSAADEPLADALHVALEEQGYTVLRAGDEGADLPLDISLDRIMNKAQAAVVVSSLRPSPWLKFELKAMQKRKLQVIDVQVGGSRSASPIDSYAHATVRIDAPTDDSGIKFAAGEIASKLR